MNTKFLSGVVGGTALVLAATMNPAMAQSPASVANAPAVIAASANDHPGDNLPIDHRMLWLAGAGVVIFLAGRRPA